jgi:hypothetical protein
MSDWICQFAQKAMRERLGAPAFRKEKEIISSFNTAT